MKILSSQELALRKCKPCEGGVEPCSLQDAEQQLASLAGWYLTHEGQRIRKDWVVTNFLSGMRFFEQVAQVAEADAHHPDLHLVGYRNVSIEIWTHAIGGLSENDFTLAAKIDQIPIKLKKKQC